MINTSPSLCSDGKVSRCSCMISNDSARSIHAYSLLVVVDHWLEEVGLWTTSIAVSMATRHSCQDVGLPLILEKVIAKFVAAVNGAASKRSWSSIDYAQLDAPRYFGARKDPAARYFPSATGMISISDRRCPASVAGAGIFGHVMLRNASVTRASCGSVNRDLRGLRCLIMLQRVQHSLDLAASRAFHLRRAELPVLESSSVINHSLFSDLQSRELRSTRGDLPAR